MVQRNGLPAERDPARAERNAANSRNERRRSSGPKAGGENARRPGRESLLTYPSGCEGGPSDWDDPRGRFRAAMPGERACATPSYPRTGMAEAARKSETDEAAVRRPKALSLCRAEKTGTRRGRKPQYRERKGTGTRRAYGRTAASPKPDADPFGRGTNPSGREPAFGQGYAPAGLVAARECGWAGIDTIPT